MALTARRIAVSEGAAFDARGYLTLVGFDPQAFVVARFPATLTPTIVAIFDDRDEPHARDGDSVRVRCEVRGTESAGTLFLNELQQNLVVDPASPLPVRVQILLQAPFSASKAGTYTAVVTLNTDDQTTECSTEFDVIETADVAAPRAS